MSKPLLILLFGPALTLGGIFIYLAVKQRAQAAIWILVTLFTAALFTAVAAWRTPDASREQLVLAAVIGAVFGTLIYIKHAGRWSYWDRQRRVTSDRVHGVSPLARITDGI